MNFEEVLDFLKKIPVLKVTVSGDIGAGKSTFSERLAKELDVPKVYVGGLMREEAKKRGLTLDEFNKSLEDDEMMDKKMDARVHEISKELDKGVFEGRVAWYFVDNPTVKVFLSVDPKVSAERIWQDNDVMRDKYNSVDELLEANRKRRENENLRYEKYYGLDAYARENFDLIIDTTHLSKNESYEKIVKEIADFIKMK